MVEWLSGLALFDIAVMILSALVALGVLIAFHEYGHFWVARRCGVHVEQFSIGFGPALWSGRDRHGTEYRLAALPLGGFVKMRGETSTADGGTDTSSYQSKSVWQRMAIVVAGPLANLLLAIAFFWLVLLGGERDIAPQLGELASNSAAERAGLQPGMLITAVGDVPVATLSELNRELFDYLGATDTIAFTAQSELGASNVYRIAVERWLSDQEAPQPLAALGIGLPYQLDALLVRAIAEGSPAEAAGLQVGDRIVAVEGQPLHSASRFSTQLAAAAGAVQELTIERSSSIDSSAVAGGYKTLYLPIAARSIASQDATRWLIGIEFSQIGSYPQSLWLDVRYNPATALLRAIEQTIDMSTMVLASVGKLVTGELSPKNLSGPITIAKVAGDSAQSGWDNFLRFVAFLSIMLGIMNLLPIPVLDGGRLVFYLLEAVRGRPLSERIQQVSMQWGLAVMLGLMGLALFNDLT